MPYRRRSRGGYYRRRTTTRPTTWVRNESFTTTRIGAGTIWGVDLLAPLHTEEALMKVGGQYENAPSTHNRTVLRIIGQIMLQWHVDELTGQFQLGDGAYMGIRRAVWPLETATVGPVPVPTPPQYSEDDPYAAANTTDWMFWRSVSALEDVTTDATSDLQGTGGDRLGIWHFDVRSKRRLSELGDTACFLMRPGGSGTQGIEYARITTSTLLR